MNRRGSEGSTTRRMAVLAIALAILAMLSGCSTAKVYRSRVGMASERVSSFAGARVPGPITAEVLARHDLGSPLGLVRPGRAADRLVASGAATSDPDGLLALADLRAKAARRAEVFAPSQAPDLYLDAIETAMTVLAATPPDRSEVEATRIYNDAVAGFLQCTAGNWMKLDQGWRARLAARGIEVRVGSGTNSWDPQRFDHFYFAGDYRVLGIRDLKGRTGLGVSLIAERRTPPFSQEQVAEGEEKYYPRRLQAYPATVLLQAEPREEGGKRVVTLNLLDPMRADAVEFDGTVRPLAGDLTTPLAFYFTSLPLPQITQVGLLRPGVLEKETGLYLLHPYEPGKIPVVLIHGLWSSPDTWHQALDELRGDPELRARYQFWVYFYPTGDPFLYSATRLRHALAEVRQTLDPDRADPAFDQMVLVGHSMGGLLSRLMVVDSGTTFWETVANRPFGELQGGPGQKELIAKTFFFEPNPSIRRVIFVATPHRGSSIGGALIGRLTNGLIRLPGMFEATQRDLMAENPEGFFKNANVVAPATSITQLTPKSGALVALNERPFAPGIPYHSIIATTGTTPLESSTDLIVPYASSHLDGAASETIVKGTHACLQSDETIAEIRRILGLHLREIGATAPTVVPVDAKATKAATGRVAD